MVTTFRPIYPGRSSAPQNYLSSMAESSRIAHHGGHNATVKLDTRPQCRGSTSCSPIRATSHPRACMNLWASPRSIRHLGIALNGRRAPRNQHARHLLPRATSPTTLMPSVTLASSHGATAGISAQQSIAGLRAQDSLLRSASSSSINVLQQMQTTKGLVFRRYPFANNSTACRDS